MSSSTKIVLNKRNENFSVVSEKPQKNGWWEGSVRPAAVGHEGREMDRLERSGLWGKKKPRLEEEKAGSELQQILPSDARGNPRQQRKGRPPKLAQWLTGFSGRFLRNKRPRNVFHLTENSKGFCSRVHHFVQYLLYVPALQMSLWAPGGDWAQQEVCLDPQGFLELVQDGWFLEACQSISRLEEEGQDCGAQYEAVARSMWQVVQQALDGTGPSQELEQKLRAVLATVEWTQDQHERRKASAPQDSGVATWAGQLNKLLRNDAETQVPTLGPKDQLDLYLEKLDKAVRQGLGSPRASRLGTCLWEVYRTYFHEVLLGRLSELTQSCGADLKSCQVLYTWGKTNLFEQPGETLAKACRTSWEPVVGHLLDPLMFVTWMSQMQQMLVGLIQEELRKHLDRVLFYDLKKWAQCSHPTFLDVFQLLEEGMNAAHPMGLPISSQVQGMILETFSDFLKSYQQKAVGFIQQNAVAGAFPELHVLANCCILRETWQELTQKRDPLVDLGPCVQGTIHDIEDHSRDHLLPRVRALCQSLLRDHFGQKNKGLVGALQFPWQGLEGCPTVHSTATYELSPRPLHLFVLLGEQRTMRRLHMVVFGEYVLALATHLKMLEPRKWEGLQHQVQTDTRALHNIFTKHRDLSLAHPKEPIMEIFQSTEHKNKETVDDWLASFRDRFPGYVSTQDQPCSSVDLEEIKVYRRSCCRCC
ncbi:uncharacterized protein LOC116591933 isoform X2 [Mustela erminea]|uniref:uncharacterized protein LOC116591933 isoform X2 n=1 Tax=Mustela erminea TaxID=36723 RepID=UPI0013872523|nr:uncharacterized protein LOC116591933 isoform X2 [Mustela erminea]